MMKKLALAAAALALGGTALLVSGPASAASPGKGSGIIVEARYDGPGYAQRHRKPARVQASGISRGVLLPYAIKKARAQREAVSNWNAKVRSMYGARYANWNRASAKSTSCSRTGAAVSCRVSAVPNAPRYGML